MYSHFFYKLQYLYFQMLYNQWWDKNGKDKTKVTIYLLFLVSIRL